jgi:nitric oxide reductase NorE protein
MLARTEDIALRPPVRSGGLPGDSGVWVFILADMAAFALLFLLFAIGRTAAPDVYEHGRRTLNVALGLTNTLVLLTSSWTMVQAVQAARLGDRTRTTRFLVLTLAVGSGFAVSKAVEYAAKAQAGLSLLSGDFYMYYFVLTGIHFLHFLIGMVAVGVTLNKARSPALDGRFRVWIESVGAYWHMVDLLWIMLFPLLYLQRAS